MHWRVITEHFDTPKTNGLWLVVEHFYGLKQILTANSLHTNVAFNKDAFVFLNENFGHLTLILEK